MKTILYLGTNLAFSLPNARVIHFPIISIAPRSFTEKHLFSSFEDLPNYSHFIFTSKNAVAIFFQYATRMYNDLSFMKKKEIYSVGEVTAQALDKYEVNVSFIAHPSTQEGLIKKMTNVNWQNTYVMLPKSSLARPLIENFLKDRQIRYQAPNLYDTITNKNQEVPSLDLVDEIVFTSPSTVKAFTELYGNIPQNKKITSIGPITQQALDEVL